MCYSKDIMGNPMLIDHYQKLHILGCYARITFELRLKGGDKMGDMADDARERELDMRLQYHLHIEGRCERSTTYCIFCLEEEYYKEEVELYFNQIATGGDHKCKGE